MSDGGDVVLVTGASSGLGLALARRLLDRAEYRLILTARERSLPRFEDAGIRSGERVWLRPLEVTDRAQRVAVVDEAEARWGGVDVLVNNAGVAYRSVVEHVNEEERLRQMDINFLAPMHLMRLVLPGMRAKRHGRILNVSSVGGMMAMPTMAIYAASKFALEGATEALWYEVRPWGIHVTLIEPGFIRSPSFQNTRYTVDSQASHDSVLDPYHEHYEAMEPFIKKWMTSARATPDKVARRIVRAMRARKPPLRIQTTFDARLFSMLRRVMPQRLYHAFLRRNLPQVKTWGKR